ncbi:hypothetical protein ColTof3_00006 [Colletotrichum tofieldiae]|nr:hypothetical protein ColTof3_00006 [Colletotrichum tofieldiae]
MDLEENWPLTWPQKAMLIQADDKHHVVNQTAVETADYTESDYLIPVYPDGSQPGGGEADLPASYLKRQCHEIMKLVLQGATLVLSTVDYGRLPPRRFRTGESLRGSRRHSFLPVHRLDMSPISWPSARRSSTTSEITSTTNRSVPPSGGSFSECFDAPTWQKCALSICLDEVTNLNFTGYEEMGINFIDVGDGVHRAARTRLPLAGTM